jgi:hypothetical protein
MPMVVTIQTFQLIKSLLSRNHPKIICFSEYYENSVVRNSGLIRHYKYKVVRVLDVVFILFNFIHQQMHFLNLI